jgi:hypothetical protein
MMQSKHEMMRTNAIAKQVIVTKTIIKNVDYVLTTFSMVLMKASLDNKLVIIDEILIIKKQLARTAKI